MPPFFDFYAVCRRLVIAWHFCFLNAYIFISLMYKEMNQRNATKEEGFRFTFSLEWFLPPFDHSKGGPAAGRWCSEFFCLGVLQGTMWASSPTFHYLKTEHCSHRPLR